MSNKKLTSENHVLNPTAISETVNGKNGRAVIVGTVVVLCTWALSGVAISTFAVKNGYNCDMSMLPLKFSLTKAA